MKHVQKEKQTKKEEDNKIVLFTESKTTEISPKAFQFFEEYYGIIIQGIAKDYGWTLNHHIVNIVAQYHITLRECYTCSAKIIHNYLHGFKRRGCQILYSGITSTTCKLKYRVGEDDFTCGRAK